CGGAPGLPTHGPAAAQPVPTVRRGRRAPRTMAPLLSGPVRRA
ncbi:MAG: hypothetical protein AVDCRST_MAG19-1207, partial [uncultured Thermomicrobiales bacterium]